jgi:GH24 family phage-related lysozyme (muramidase)
MDKGTLDAFRQMQAQGSSGGGPETSDMSDEAMASRSVQAPNISPARLNPGDSVFQMPGYTSDVPARSWSGLSDIFSEDAKIRMTASDKLREYLTGREKYRQNAYNDNPQHPERGTMTVGYGHTGNVDAIFAHYPGGVPLHPSGRFMFDTDLEPAERAVREKLRIPVSQNQYDALVDYAFNAGVGALRSSPMLGYVNAGDFDKAADAFAGSRITQKGLRSKGLENRRADEADMFTTGNLIDRYSKR